MTDIREEGIEILRTLCGSRAYGLEDDESDFDYHGVFVIPTSRLLAVGMPKVKETHWLEGSTQDDTAWELGHFLSMALRCNPTVLETFVAPVVDWGPVRMAETGPFATYGEILRALFAAVVSREQVYDSFRGYAKNQRTKMFEPTGGVRGGERKWKFASTYLRVLSQGADLLQNGPAYWTVQVEGPGNEFLRSVKYGHVSMGQVIDEAERRETVLTAAYLKSTMQLEPQLERVNEFLLTARKDFW